MSSVYLTVVGNSHTGYRLHPLSSFQSIPASVAGQDFRISPIFPVIPNSPPPDLTSAVKFVAFICPLNAVDFISKQTNQFHKQAWFSHGLASVILFSDNDKWLKMFFKKNESHLAAYEVWKVDPNKLDIKVKYLWLRQCSPPKISFVDCSTLNKDAQSILQEIFINFREILDTSARFLPEQVKVESQVITHVNEIVAELVFLNNPATVSPPAFLTQAIIKQCKQDPYYTDLRVNQAISLLIQLNSALSYVISQSLHGSVPILDRKCLAGNYSLLGTGTAYRALSAITRYIEKAFRDHPVLKSIDHNYRLPGSGFEVFPLITRYRPEVWKGSFPSGLKLLPGVTDDIMPKIVHFSARLGFGESHFCATAASQVLNAADSVRWSLMTLTHELLHTHVSGILAMIMGEAEGDGMSDVTFRKYHKAFLAHIRNAANDKACIPKTAAESLLFVFFSFAATRAGLASVSTPASQKSRITSEIDITAQTDLEEFKRGFCNELRLLEEILVHTLDLRYFYLGDQDTFLSLLWESWTTVPAVAGDLDTYLLRSLSAIGSLDDGSPTQRFKSATTRLSNVLDRLIINSKDNHFLHKAKERITTRRAYLQELFYPCIYVADAAATFLYSSKIESFLWGNDINIDTGEKNSVIYSMDTADYSHGIVSNPVPFLSDRLRRCHTTLDEDYRSSWLLLAAASATG